jgi:hypothetical protein
MVLVNILARFFDDRVAIETHAAVACPIQAGADIQRTSCDLLTQIPTAVTSRRIFNQVCPVIKLKLLKLLTAVLENQTVAVNLQIDFQQTVITLFDSKPTVFQPAKNNNYFYMEAQLNFVSFMHHV